MSRKDTMKAAVIRSPGGPESFAIEELPVPSPGIEAVGEVVDGPGNEFAKGAVVATCMGGMGRMFDGGYAEYTCVPASNVQEIKTKLSFEILGAMPEMLQTAWGSLSKSLRIESDEHILIRGGKDRFTLLKDSGADACLVDDGNLAAQVARQKFDKVLELIGPNTLQDSLNCIKEGGIVCQTGIFGNKWLLNNINPMEFIPSAVCLTVYSGSEVDFRRTPLGSIAEQVVNDELKIQVGKVCYRLENIVKVYELMDSNRAGGKISCFPGNSGLAAIDLVTIG